MPQSLTLLRNDGEEFGADGVEISAHALCAEDHLPYQGQQYSNEEFEQIQQALKREIGQWNCKHTIHPIILGVSPRTYTDEQLKEINEKSTEEITIGDTTLTRYQWSQRMRKLETEMRYARDDLLVAKAMEDKAGKQEAMNKISGLMEVYNRIGKQTKIGTDYTRTWLDRLGGIGEKSNTSLTVSGRNGIIASEDDGYYRRRKIKNNGVFSVYQEPISLSHVKKVLRQMGIYRKDVHYKVNNDESIIGRGFYGYTSYDGKEITYYPDAFKNMETLVKTLKHEDVHYLQVKNRGKVEDTDEGMRRENEAKATEQEAWDAYRKRVYYHDKQ